MIDADALLMELDMTEDLSAYDAVVFEEMVNVMPTADVRPNVHGEWHHISSTGWECSACGRVVTMRPIDKKKTLYNFCPNCGADMRKGENNG